MRGKIFTIVVLSLSLGSMLNAFTDFKTAFSNLTSSLVLSDTGSSLNLANDSSLIGWKGGSVIQAVDPSNKVDYRNQVIFDKLDTIRLKKEYVFAARSYLRSFNLAGETYFDQAWGGNVDLISIGSAAHVWAVKDSKFYLIDIDGESQVGNAKFPWHEKGAAPGVLSVGRDETVWGLGGIYGGLTYGVPYWWNDKNSSWNAIPKPAAVNDLLYLSVCDKNNIWAIGVNYTGPVYSVYNWHNDTGQWIDRSQGAIYPDKGISVGGDGLIDIIILGIKTNVAGDQLVLWDRTSETWNDVSLGLSGHTIDAVSVGRRDNMGIIITPSGSSFSNFYKIEKLSRSAPYSATLIEVRKEVSDIEMGYYGDAWFYDPYEVYWHRLVGGVIRSTVNYLAQMPNITSLKGLNVVPPGLHEEADFTTVSSTEITEETVWAAPPGLESPLSLNGGVMRLQTDLSFSSTTYLVTGGRIEGRGYAIFLGNDFEIPENQSLRFTDTTAIDGFGASLILKNNAKLKVDSGVTLSLRNLVIKGLQDATGSVIEMSENSFLSLQNVEFALSGDYTFTQGYIFVNDDFKLTGTSKLIYQNSKESFIAEHSRLYFDLGTTFSYVPDSGARNLLKLKDATTVLYLSSCTFAAPADATYNGLELTKGTIVFENSIDIKNLNNGVPNTDINKAITLGDGSSADNDLSTKVLSGAMLNIEGYLDYNPN